MLFSSLAVLVVLTGMAVAATLTVGPTSSGCDYTKIQAAINAATAGDTIEVHNGTYREDVNVNKRLTLSGVDMPVVDAGGSGSAITLNADGCTVMGFVATNSGANWPNSGIYVNSDKNIIKGNTATGNRYGISLTYTSGNTIEGNTASNNEYGIYLYESCDNTIEGNTANDNTATDNNHGIYLSRSSDNTIEGNTATGNKYGITLSASSGNTVSGNTANNNKAGVYLAYSSSGNTIEGNTATGNDYGIYLLRSSDNTVEGNTATGNNDYGIYL